MRPPTSPWIARAAVFALLAACTPAQDQAAATEPAGARAARTDASRYFDDENIAAVLTASNQGEIEPSRLALERSQDPEVLEFARAMIRDHTNLQDRMDQQLAANGERAVHNALSLTMMNNLDATVTDLTRLSGARFDDAYIHQQIASHEMALRTLDTTLIPNVTDPALRDLLVDQARPAVADHLEWIRRIHASRTAHTRT